MSLDEYNRHSTLGPIAGPATTAAASAGQEAYRNRTEPADAGGAGSFLGVLIVSLARGGWIGRGVLVLLGDFALALATVGNVPREWADALAILLLAIAFVGFAMVGFGLFLLGRRLFLAGSRWLRKR